MSMVGHKTEIVCRRYAIVDEAMQREADARLDAFTAISQAASKTGRISTFKPKASKATTSRQQSA